MEFHGIFFLLKKEKFCFAKISISVLLTKLLKKSKSKKKLMVEIISRIYAGR